MRGSRGATAKSSDESRRVARNATTPPTTMPAKADGESTPHDVPNDLGGLSAHRHPDTDLPAPFIHPLCQDAVDADPRKEYGEARKQPQHKGLKATRREGAADHLVE